jgi:hypothetical protein
MKKACADPGDRATAMSKAWESDPDLRLQFGEAVSAGLRKMWADPVARRLQSKRTKQTYEQGDLRERRSEHLKKLWADPDTREKMLAVVEQKRGDQQFAEAVAAAARKSWSNPRKKAQRIAKVKATRAARSPEPRPCLFCGEIFAAARRAFCSHYCWRQDWLRRQPPPQPRPCLFCGKTFVPSKESRSREVFFCSCACANRARARR